MKRRGFSLLKCNVTIASEQLQPCLMFGVDSYLRFIESSHDIQNKLGWISLKAWVWFYWLLFMYVDESIKCKILLTLIFKMMEKTLTQVKEKYISIVLPLPNEITHFFHWFLLMHVWLFRFSLVLLLALSLHTNYNFKAWFFLITHFGSWLHCLRFFFCFFLYFEQSMSIPEIDWAARSKWRTIVMINGIYFLQYGLLWYSEPPRPC